MAYNEPRDPYGGSNMFGDMCIHVSMCKFIKVDERYFYYRIGSQSSAEFTARRNVVKNSTSVELTFRGIRSLSHVKTHITLVCDLFRIKPEDAEFRITADKIRGDIYAELAHVCACPGACEGKLSPPDVTENHGKSTYKIVQGMAEDNAAKEKSFPVSSNARSLLIVFGINIGLLILAVFIGGLCYSKRSALRSYNKLPGLHATWAGANKGDLLSMSRKAYRDYEPHEDKPQFLPVLEECEIPIGHLEVKQRLGGNVFGDTYKGRWKDRSVAIKCITHGIQLSQNNSDIVKKIKTEVSILSKARHKNIAAMIGMCFEAKFPYIVNEMINGRSVKEYILAEDYVSWSQKIRMCIQAADGMTFLHSVKPNPILHRDLRCANLMITPEEIVIVVDFGVTAILQPVREECQRAKCFCQKELSACPASIRWTAPEILHQTDSEKNQTTFTTSCDVYSFGMILWEMLKGENPFCEIQAELEIMEIVKAGGRPVIPQDISIPSKYKDLMKELWEGDPLRRPTFKQVVSALKEAMSQARHLEKHGMSHTQTSRSSTPVTQLV
ncbi:uncharacterized protein LOC135475493 isoform X2 [Liolophura sinensis]|uniref:uncharacterized protein LOC135475493 isoform X2 n=2 Tax=Liolophura sinensis TaxID=3198878 RepID=UPI003158F98F